MRKPSVCIAVLAALSAAGGIAPSHAAPAPLGKVVRAQALFQAGQNAKTPSPLKAGDAVYEGEALETHGEPAVLALQGGGVSIALKLGPATRLTLKGTPGHELFAELERGSVLSDVHNPAKAPHPFAVRTANAVMGVRGTVFFVKADPGKPLFLCTCNGKVSLAAANHPDHAIEVTSTHHDHPLTLADGSGALSERMAPAPMGTDHSDDDATELEKALAR